MNKVAGWVLASDASEGSNRRSVGLSGFCQTKSVLKAFKRGYYFASMRVVQDAAECARVTQPRDQPFIKCLGSHFVPRRAEKNFRLRGDYASNRGNTGDDSCQPSEEFTLIVITF